MANSSNSSVLEKAVNILMIVLPAILSVSKEVKRN